MAETEKKSNDKNINKEVIAAHINGKYSLASVIIGGIFSIIALVISNNIGKKDAINELMSRSEEILSTENYASDNVNTVDELIERFNQIIIMNNSLQINNNDLEYKNRELEIENNTLSNKNESLQTDIKSLRDQLSQYSTLKETNQSLMDEIELFIQENNALNAEVTELKSKLDKLQMNTSDPSVNSPPIPTLSLGEKVSIFGLDTFRGDDHWHSRSDKSDSYFIDTYGEDYPNAHLGYHSSHDENDLNSEPTYLLDKKYSICQGHIAWSKKYKNSNGSAWIDFYSGSTLIYSSPIITADSRLTEFSCDVSGVEKLTVMVNGTTNVYIIYQDFDLIEAETPEGVAN